MYYFDRDVGKLERRGFIHHNYASERLPLPTVSKTVL